MVQMLVLVLNRIQLSEGWCWCSYLCRWYSYWYCQGYYWRWAIILVLLLFLCPGCQIPHGSSLCPFTTKCRFYKVQHFSLLFTTVAKSVVSSTSKTRTEKLCTHKAQDQHRPKPTHTLHIRKITRAEMQRVAATAGEWLHWSQLLLCARL